MFLTDLCVTGVATIKGWLGNNQLVDVSMSIEALYKTLGNAGEYRLTSTDAQKLKHMNN